ncbi:hypothetical protein FH972_013357 [Carpinus fangiana]|uniref:Tocopherol cyclase n=1 Tax=Carpinus fangiana TaxID=176857 RepID=A0A5N6R6J1_9ROSI|nr:hypothetical protein FH972_013357 [Carpinus fangiana]
METMVCSLCEPHHFSPNFGLPSINLKSSVKLAQPSKLSSFGTQRSSPKQGFQPCPRVFASSSTVEREREKEEEEEGSGSVTPAYVPMPPNREHRTPHSGYHFDGSTRKFFEGRHELMLGNTFIAEKELKPPNKEVPPQEFSKRVLEGFQVSPLWNQGFIRDDGRSNYVDTVKTARWEYSTHPTYGWGNVGSKQKSTAGWLAAFPVFEPHWQICMASGLSTGWIEWDGERFEFQNAPSYSEKNWGGAFPRKWFWVQCNVFEGASGEVALTAAGGLRQLPGLTENFENAALVGVHYDGIFYEFVPWNGGVSWEIAPWGYWYMAGENQMHKVELEVTTKDPGTTLRAPTSEAGFAPVCKDSCFGELRLRIWVRRYDGSKGKMILDVTSNMAAVEVGGGPWFNTWKGETSTPELINRALNVPIDVEGIFGFTPLFKPPGL